jgi:hypothetical protein
MSKRGTEEDILRNIIASMPLFRGLPKGGADKTALELAVKYDVRIETPAHRLLCALVVDTEIQIVEAHLRELAQRTGNRYSFLEGASAILKERPSLRQVANIPQKVWADAVAESAPQHSEPTYLQEQLRFQHARVPDVPHDNYVLRKQNQKAGYDA